MTCQVFPSHVLFKKMPSITPKTCRVLTVLETYDFFNYLHDSPRNDISTSAITPQNYYLRK